MRVLLAAPASGASGGINRWTKHILAYYESLNNKPVSLEIFDLARSEYIPDDISLVPRIRLAVKDYSSIIKGFKVALKEKEFDVVHITSSAGLGLIRDLLMLKMAHKKGIKTIVHFRFGRIPQLFKQNNWETKLLKEVIKKTDHVIVLDRCSYETLGRNGYNNISQLPNPLAPKVLEQIASIGTVERKPRQILFIGHCISTKGIFELVEACKDIKGINLRLVGAINDDVRKHLSDLAQNGGWLDIIGEKPYEEVIKQMLSCDVFVLPTYTEGFPNVILEAMACGCAIVTTPVGAIPEMLETENGQQFGLMIESRNVNALRDALLQMLDNSKMKDECGRNAQKRVEERYNIASVWRQMVGIWKQV